MLTYRYRIKDSTRRKHLQRMAWAVNYVWNYCNEVSMLAFRRNKTFLSAYDLHRLTTGTSKDLRISADTIEQVCDEYVARRRQRKKVRLRWRSKKRSLGWVPFRAGTTRRSNIRWSGTTVTYCGYRFRLWLSRRIDGVIKVGSFTQDASGHWYVNFKCEVDDTGIPSGTAPLGIDLGLKDHVSCSDGVKYSRDNLTRRHEDALAIAQRANKKRRVTAIYAKISHQRQDWAHKTSTAIVQRAKLIAVGDVSSSKLAKTRLAKSIYDAGWYQLRTMLGYKAKRLGIEYCVVNESGSSVTCADCGTRCGPHGLSQLGVRVWCCAHCGVVHDRDHNAARNILRLGRQTLLQGIP